MKPSGSSSVVLRLLLSNRARFNSKPGQLSSSYLSISSYSSAPRRSAERRGGRRGGDDDGESEDYFLRNLNFGDSGSGNRARDRVDYDDAKPVDRGASPSDAERPLRGERPMRGERPATGKRGLDGEVGGGDFFGRYGEGRGRRDERRGPAGEVRDRYKGGNRRETGGGFRDGFGLSGPRKSKANFQFDGLDEREQVGKDGRFGGFSVQKLELGDENGTPESYQDKPKESVIHNLKFSSEPASPPQNEATETTDPQPPLDSSAESDENPAIPDSAREEANAIFRQMKETGLVPHAVAMLDGLCKDGLVQEAMKLFGKMREKGTIPEVVIYTAVVEGFCKAAKYEDAKRIFRKMQKNGIDPNPFSYKVIVEGLYKGKKVDDSIDFCLEMLDKGHPVSVGTFTGLVDRICREKGLEEAEKVVRRLRERELAVDDKAVKEHLDRKGPFSPLVVEAIFGKKKHIGRLI